MSPFTILGAILGALTFREIEMSYRNKTYVIFEAGNDLNKYQLMRAWKQNKNIDFNFHDAHDLNTITNLANEETTKAKLRQRFSNAKKAIVLIGEKTKTHYRFVRWEIEVAQALGLPLVAVNLNGMRSFDAERCPAILRDANAVHVSFNAAIIKFALDDFSPNEQKSSSTNYYYGPHIYERLGL